MQKYLANFATNNINFWFFTQHMIIWPRETGLDCITNFLIDNSSKSSYFPKGASTKNFCHTYPILSIKGVEGGEFDWIH